MCPEKAKVFIAEDDNDWEEILTEAMVLARHDVVFVARDVPSGLAAIPEVQKLGVDVALVDGKIPFNPNDGN